MTDKSQVTEAYQAAITKLTNDEILLLEQTADMIVIDTSGGWEKLGE